MISNAAKKYLSSLVYSKNAERNGSIMPLGGIYWSDEIPDFKALRFMPDKSRGEIYRLLRIRYDLWDDIDLSQEDCKFLEMVSLIVPDCPILRRLVPTDDDREAQKDVRGELMDIHEMMVERSAGIEVKKNPDGTFSTSWRLKDEEEIQS